jgi:hypothetical protein
MITSFCRWDARSFGIRRLALISILPVLLLASTIPLRATSCLGSNLAYSETGNTGDTYSPCSSWGRCRQPMATLLSYSFNVPGCDPHSGSCGMTASVAAITSTDKVWRRPTPDL